MADKEAAQPLIGANEETNLVDSRHRRPSQIGKTISQID